MTPVAFLYFKMVIVMVMMMIMMMIDDDYGNESEYPNVYHCVHRSASEVMEVMLACEVV